MSPDAPNQYAHACAQTPLPNASALRISPRPAPWLPLSLWHNHNTCVMNDAVGRCQKPVDRVRDGGKPGGMRGMKPRRVDEISRRDRVCHRAWEEAAA